MRILLALSLLLPLSAARTLAAGYADCDATHPVDKYQLLRRLSFDLRGKPPTVDEYAALDTAGDEIPAAVIDAFVKGDDFRLAMRRYHEAMFWPNVSNVRLGDVNTALSMRTAAPYNEVAFMIAGQGRQQLFRGAQNVSCGDFEQTHFLAANPGEFRPDPAFFQSEVVSGVTVFHEGWRMVTPYWDKTAPIKVCAFDAQETVTGSLAAGGTAKCGTNAGMASKDCGCGPGLKWCYGPGAVSTKPILDALREQLDLSVDDVTVGGKPYTDLLLSTKAWQNGPLAFWKQNLAPQVSYALTYDAPDPGEPIASRDFTDTTFSSVDRPAIHAGVLTLPGYLLRFQTDRGRANRFRINFLCQYFVPADTLENESAGCSNTDDDIMKRCNCRYCHSTLEPMAAHFGDFAMAGTTALVDRTAFPIVNPSCKGKSTAFCARFYVTQTDAHNAGSLLAYQWTDAHPELLTSLQGGPRALAQDAIDSGELARCTVKKVWFALQNREMHVEGEATEEAPLLDTLATGFKTSGYSFPWLVKQVVTQPQYRRVR